MADFHLGINQLLKSFLSFKPSFLWAPTTPDTFYLDRVSGLVGIPGGYSQSISSGGLNRTVAAAYQSIDFPYFNGSPAGINPSEGFVAIALVSVLNPTAQQGLFVKFGDNSSGMGFGGGNGSDADNAGSYGAILRETLAWHNSSSGFWSQGLNVIGFGNAIGTGFQMKNMASGANLSAGSSGVVGGEFRLRLHGSATARGTTAVVNAIAFYPQAGNDITSYGNLRDTIARAALPYAGMGISAVRSLFRPRRIWVPVSAAAGGGTFFNPISGRGGAAAQPVIHN